MNKKQVAVNGKIIIIQPYRSIGGNQEDFKKFNEALQELEKELEAKS